MRESRTYGSVGGAGWVTTGSTRKLTAYSLRSAPASGSSSGLAFCHNPNFSGAQQVPRLAGQREGYLVKALRAYKNNTRRSCDAAMGMCSTRSAMSSSSISPIFWRASRERIGRTQGILRPATPHQPDSAWKSRTHREGVSHPHSNLA
jgi:hypothetical protein